jgi:outer membrane protein TolC
MKHTKQLALFVFVLAITAAPLMAEEYGLKDYLAKVAQNNTDYALAQKESLLAKESVRQARSVLFPTIGAQVGYTRNLTDTIQSTPVASSPAGGALIYQDIDTNRGNELTIGIGVNQTVFDASTLANLAKAQKALAIQTQVLETTRRNIERSAKKLYAQTQLAQTLVTISENSEQTSREIYESIERKSRAGTATELDLLMAEVDWKSKIPATAQARKNAVIALIAFRDLAGIPHTEEIVLTENTDDLPDIPAALDLAAILAARPDYRAVLLSGDISDINRKAAIGSFLPKVTGGFAFAYGGMGDDSLTGDYDYTAMQITLGVSIPVFTGGYRISALKAARIEQEKARLNLSKKRTAIESEITELYLRITEARERIDSARLVEAMAKRAVALAQSSFTNGVATQLSVAEAINKHDQASLGLQNALFEYRSIYYDWELMTGAY